MTDHVKLLVRMLAETDGVIADIQSCIPVLPPADADKVRFIDEEMKSIRGKIESALKKLRAP
jgi:hypothetical protein